MAGGLLFKVGNSNMQHVTSLSFLLLAYSNYLSHANVRVPCGTSSASPVQLRRVAKRQVKGKKFLAATRIYQTIFNRFE